MAAGEDELEALVRESRCLGHLSGLRFQLAPKQLRLRLERALPPYAVDRAVARGRDQPSARLRRHAVARPALRRDRERLLCGFLGEVEVAEEADQRGQHTAPLLTEGLLERSYHSTTGRTSIAPPRRAAGIRDAN